MRKRAESVFSEGKSELEKYLEDKVEPDDEKIDVLNWWKNKIQKKEQIEEMEDIETVHPFLWESLVMLSVALLGQSHTSIRLYSLTNTRAFAQPRSRVSWLLGAYMKEVRQCGAAKDACRRRAEWKLKRR
ncbi:hypothetical protein V6N11_066754 [Hibiscus sabdariffa]|uniref:HAT C-terminal dimerisation domain-containing protein n=1 Tax=Hibiscus sabdariffa TaxID=183260 RepID=A0ABR2SNV6_9ROSI